MCFMSICIVLVSVVRSAQLSDMSCWYEHVAHVLVITCYSSFLRVQPRKIVLDVGIKFKVYTVFMTESELKQQLLKVYIYEFPRAIFPCKTLCLVLHFSPSCSASMALVASSERKTLVFLSSHFHSRCSLLSWRTQTSILLWKPWRRMWSLWMMMLNVRWWRRESSL